MPFNYGGLDDSLLLSIIKKGKAYSPDRFGLKATIWQMIIDDELRPFRDKVHIPAEEYFSQLVEHGFIKETKKSNFFYISVHFAPFDRIKTF